MASFFFQKALVSGVSVSSLRSSWRYLTFITVSCPCWPIEAGAGFARCRLIEADVELDVPSHRRVNWTVPDTSIVCARNRWIHHTQPLTVDELAQALQALLEDVVDNSSRRNLNSRLEQDLNFTIAAALHPDSKAGKLGYGG